MKKKKSRAKPQQEKCHFCGERHGRVCPEFKDAKTPFAAWAIDQQAQAAALVYEERLNALGGGGCAESLLWKDRPKNEKAAWRAVVRLFRR